MKSSLCDSATLHLPHQSPCLTHARRCLQSCSTHGETEARRLGVSRGSRLPQACLTPGREGIGSPLPQPPPSVAAPQWAARSIPPERSLAVTLHDSREDAGPLCTRTPVLPPEGSSAPPLLHLLEELEVWRWLVWRSPGGPWPGPGWGRRGSSGTSVRPLPGSPPRSLQHQAPGGHVPERSALSSQATSQPLTQLPRSAYTSGDPHPQGKKTLSSAHPPIRLLKVAHGGQSGCWEPRGQTGSWLGPRRVQVRQRSQSKPQGPTPCPHQDCSHREGPCPQGHWVWSPPPGSPPLPGPPLLVSLAIT